jgi:hypothetical protein
MNISPNVVTFGAKRNQKNAHPLGEWGNIPGSRLAQVPLTINGLTTRVGEELVSCDVRLSEGALKLHPGYSTVEPIVQMVKEQADPSRLIPGVGITSTNPPTGPQDIPEPFVQITIGPSSPVPGVTPVSGRFLIVDGVIANTPLPKSPNARPML